MARIAQLAAAAAGLFVLLFLFERALPLRRSTSSLVARLVVNLGLTALSFATAALVVRPAVAAALTRDAGTPVGLVHLLPMPPPARAVLGFLLLDLAFYYWHLANHLVPVLWRFHNVHHLDPDLDVTTGFRFHAGEVALSAAFRLVQVTLIGVGPATLAVYEAAFQLNTLFHHSNVRLPLRLERLLNLLLVTPRMHGIHHSQVRDEANSNFSVVLPWWDHLHRTLRLNVPQRRLVIGVPGYAAPADNGLWATLAAPFRRQREYWRSPAGTAVERDPSDLAGTPGRMAE
jgi:sterol desaturase/sphingolipid hydroxylase (fatty acid hydroxylase superfamily)